MQTVNLKLSQLKTDPSNVRKTDIEPTDQFIASIEEQGVIEPLTVRQNGEGYLVTNGGKRLAALHILLKKGKVNADLPVPCIVRELSSPNARDLSLTVNYMREDMHPVDVYEAFVDMVKDGMNPADIGKKYGLTGRQVDQVLALGKLAPEIRQAWRDEKLNEDAARCFTMETDQKRQAEIFASLKKKYGHLQAYLVRSAIAGETRKTEAMISFVGLAAYKQAGGGTASDLFADKDDPAEFATDTQLLKKLYDQKLKDKIADLKAEGWKWVEFQSDLGHAAEYWDSKPKKDIKVEERQKYGVLIDIGYHGDVQFKYGVQKPAEKNAAEKKSSKVGGKGADVAISLALCGRLSDQITEAATEVMKGESSLALAVVAAALTSHDSPAYLSNSGTTSRTSKFETSFELMRKKTNAELLVVLAGIAASSLSLGSQNQSSLPLAKPGDRALLEALDAKKLNAELRKKFDAPDYFGGVARQACIDAILACDPKQPLTGNEKKGELAKLAADLVKKSNAGGKSGYLPPEMRTSHYDGPVNAKKVAATSAKTKPAAKAKAKPVKKKAA